MNKNEAYLLLNSTNIYYFTHYESSFGALLLTDKERIFFTDTRYINEAKKNIKGVNVLKSSYSTLLTDIKKCLNDIDTLYIEFDIPHSQFLNISKTFDKFKILDVSDYIKNKRISKSEYEINSISNALDIAKKAYDKTLEYLKEGVTEKEIKITLEYYMQKYGASDKSFDSIVAFGSHSSIPHAHAGDKQLNKSDVILMDFGCKVNGYCSDTTRTIVYGRNQEFEKDYFLVKSINEELITMAINSAKCNELDKFAREKTKRLFSEDVIMHSLGHGVGLDIHEAPTLSYLSNEVLKEGMVVTIEPGIYKKNYGIRIEDMILIHKNDNIILSNKFNKELMII